jgi:hypothetical protein
MSRFKTIRTRGGSVVQAGLDIRHRDHPHSAATPKLGLYRGLVLKTYTPQDSEGNASGAVRRGRQIECDVLLIRTHTIVQKAIVVQRGFGVNEAHEPWIPKPATRTLDGSPLNFQVMGSKGQYEGLATAFDNTDGDMVTVQFMEGDPDYPVVTGAITHENTNRYVRAASDTKTGWAEGDNDRGHLYQDEYYVHHQGSEVRINAQGDVLIDTVGAYRDRSTEDNSASVGDIRMRVKDGQRLTIAMGSDEDTLEIYKDGGQLRIDLGEAAAERLVLGDSFLSFFNQFVQTFNNHTHPYTDTGAVPPASVTTPTTTPGTEMTEVLLSDLAKTKKT